MIVKHKNIKKKSYTKIMDYKKILFTEILLNK